MEGTPMRTRTKLLVTAIVLLACAGGLAALADQYVVLDRLPGGGSGCMCPQIWAPVICTAPNGSHGVFSNACFAGCYGYTDCHRIVIPE